MFKGGVNANDLARLRGEKKLKEKEPREKNDKDHAGEASGSENSDSRTHSLLRDEISSLEKRIYLAIEDKFEKLGSSTILSQQLAFEDINKKIGDLLVCQLKTMEASIIKNLSEVIGQLSSRRDVPVEEMDFEKSHQPDSATANTTPSEAQHQKPDSATGNCSIPVMPDNSTPSELAEFRIRSVINDLDMEPDLSSLPGNTDVVSPRQNVEAVSPVFPGNPESAPVIFSVPAY